MARARDALTWLTPTEGESTELFGSIGRFRVGEVEFHCSSEERGSQPGLFVIRKDRRMVEEYLDLLGAAAGGNVVELGIAEGGSVALTALAANPGKLVAFELRPERVEALDRLIERLGLADVVRPHYGIDQGDRDAVGAIAEAEFGDEPLDLVIDDASHRLEQTRASFETLFSRLRPGGLFVIEDWNHQHLRAAALAARASPLYAWLVRRVAGGHDPPLSRLVIELVLAQAESDEHVAGIAIGLRWVAIRRGEGALDPATFRVSELITSDMGLLGD